MKRASAYLRKGKIFIGSYSKTSTGLWVFSGPVCTINEDHINELGQKIRDALNRSGREVVRHPANQEEWKAVQAPMLEAAGVKTWAAFAKGAKAVGLESDGATVKMEPSSNYENKGGTSLPEKTFECELMNPNLGNALMMLFDACS